MTRLREIKKETRPTINHEPQQPKIISCQISKGKLITQLDDEREISIPIALLTKYKVLEENVRPEQLKKYELWGDGKVIYFPEIDETLPSWIIIKGLHSACRD